MDTVRTIPQHMNPENNRRISSIVNDAGRRLLRFIRSRVRTDADAEDVLQEVWQQLVVTINSGPIEQIGAWLYTVARHRIIDRYRKPPPASLDALTEDDDFGLDLVTAALRDDHTPRAEHCRQLFWETLRDALAELPDTQRQVFIWHELEGLSFQDIATRTGEKVNTLLSRKRYAVLYLRERLGPLREEFLSRDV
jgi:RNA polymerase sigma factor (sigma-70 family)